MRKEIKKIVEKLIAQGWTVEQGKNHLLAKSPDGVTIVVLPSTPGGGRWKQNLIAQLKRGGFVP